jgi:hypothetical protein
MYWKSCDIEFFRKSDQDWVKIIGCDVFNNKPYWVYIPKANFEMLLTGKSINESLKGFDFSIKNFLAKGIAPKTESVFTFEREVKKIVYITNATANSIAFYAWLYISKCTNDNFSQDILKDMFLKQSEEFLSIYAKLLRNPDVLIGKLSKNEYEQYFKDTAVVDIPKLLRKVYHVNLECDYMRSPFEEDTRYYANTGVFFERNLINGTSYYCLDENYLKELGMRQCKKCNT